MSISTTERLFATTNLDPALAEAVEAAPADRMLEGIIRLEDPGQVPAGFRVVSRFHRICTGRFAAGLAWTIRRHPNVISFKASRPLGLHDDGLRRPDRFDSRSRDIQSWRTGASERLPFTGRGCIVAALDFGLDFAHPNFLNHDGTTRLLALWDQGAAYDPAHPNRFGYGRQYTPAEINGALAAADPYRALGYGPQPSDSGKGTHGAHTMDIAAGNGRAAGSRPGAACEAALLFVHLSTARLGTSENLGDSVRLLEALDWVHETARGRPWVVNLSVGSTAGSHDGTSLVEQGMHELLRSCDNGAICQSGGNYRSADLAVHGRLEDGEHRDLGWIIDPADTTPNELDAWYSGKDRFIVALRPPQGADVFRVSLGEAAAITHDGAVVGRLYHRKNDPSNGDNHVEIFLYPNAPPGTWTLRLTGDYVINGRYHAWIERDLAKPGAQSRFDPGISSSAYTVGTIATSPLVITVGAYDGHAEDAPVAPFSSCGPTRDERYDKPELLAPGVDVLAARSIPRGALRQEGLLVERSGTSMACPHVTGVVATLFEAAGGRPVSIGVIRECLKLGAMPHRHADDGDCCAWGRLDPAAAIRAMLAWVKSELVVAPEWIDAAELASAGVPTAEEAQMAELRIVVVDEKGQALVDGCYVATQGATREAGDFATSRNGLALLKSIDPARPFVFEVKDRACAIQAGAYIDPDDSAIEYGGTWFDWTLVRDDDQPDAKFWPAYRRELGLAAGIDLSPTPKGRRVERFLQHEHLVRRPLRLTKAARAGTESVRLVAHPTRLRAGPLVRYADHERAVVWLETVTPAMVRVTCKGSRHCASTIRVGGRYFVAVEITGLHPGAFYSYTLELAPLPGSGAIPVASQAINDVFPALTGAVAAAVKAQLTAVSLDGSEWLAFRTLRRTYERGRLRFATGSCRMYPGDLDGDKDRGPDMMVGLGRWLIANRSSREKWPDFLFLIGDQIYADEIGNDHGDMLIQGRFAARVPGPIDAASDARNKLVDGAWAGRFAHRFKAYHEPDKAQLDRVKADLHELGELYRKYPEIKDFYLSYAKSALSEKEQREMSYNLMRALTFELGGKVTDQKVYDEARGLLHTAETLNVRSGSYRAFLPHWTAGSDAGLRRNPMVRRYLVHNFLLFDPPIFEALLPRVIDSPSMALVTPSVRGHLPAGEGGHAADFAEYAYVYERAWAGSPEVRQLLAHIPTFLMLDDHEATDDWNFGVSWVRMLHNSQDALRLWPKTLTDALAAYWMYQGWCNKAPSQWRSDDPQVDKAPSQWRSDDPRVRSLLDAQRSGRDALPDLRRCIHAACFMQEPSSAAKATFQTGLGLDWHYQLPFDPPFLVPDCRTRKFLVRTDEDLRVIDHDDPQNRPLSQTIDSTQLEWIRRALVKPDGPSVAFLGLSTPFLMQHKLMEIMMRPETAAQAWDQAPRATWHLPELPALISAAAGATLLTSASNALLRIFRRAMDLEHMIRDKSWRDLWDLVASMQQAGSRTKTLVLVSGDVHHNYCMTANLAERGRPQPELLQVTCSGFQTTVRLSLKERLGKALSDQSFNIGKRRLVPGFMFKQGTRKPEVALYENAAALVEVSMASQVNVQVTYLSGADEYVYLYTSGAAYLKDGEPIDSPWQKGRPRLIKHGAHDGEFGGESVPLMTNVAPPARRDRALANEEVTS